MLSSYTIGRLRVLQKVPEASMSGSTGPTNVSSKAPRILRLSLLLGRI